MFLSELGGFLDLYKPFIKSTFKYIYEKETGRSINDTDLDAAESDRLIPNIIYNLFKAKKIKASQLTQLRLS